MIQVTMMPQGKDAAQFPLIMEQIVESSMFTGNLFSQGTQMTPDKTSRVAVL